MIGNAELVFSRKRGRTILERSRIEAPMAIVRPFDLPDGGLLIQIVSLGPGLCGGDRITVAVQAGEGTRVAVTTTAATRVMSMDPETHAEQRISLRAEANASVEYYPCLTIPYPGSALRQTIDVEAAPTARVGVVECWAMGRVARAEYLAFRSLTSRTTISCGGRRAYVDVMHLEPECVDLAAAGILAGRRYLANGVWTGVEIPVDEEPATRQLGGNTLAAFGTSSAGVGYLRALGTEGPCIDAVIGRSILQVAKNWAVVPVCLQRFHS